MTCRPDKVLLAALLALLALPALAVPGGDPFSEAARAIERGDGIAAEDDARAPLRAGETEQAADAYLGEAAMVEGDLHRGAVMWNEMPSAERTAANVDAAVTLFLRGALPAETVTRASLVAR